MSSGPVVPRCLGEAARKVLETPDPTAKAEASLSFAATWRTGRMPPPRTDCGSPDAPARPARPELRAPRDMPRRRGSGPAARIALLHALAHIELNAIDLAWDLIARFASERWPRDFYDDWVTVAEDEARHFVMLNHRLAALGSTYGALPAHGGMWETADNTRHDALARLAAVPLVLEARALDVTPGMIVRLRKAGDAASAETIEVIAAEEVGHVAAGWRWFDWLCGRRGLLAQDAFADLVRAHIRAPLKPPFNEAARGAAGLPRDVYHQLV